MVERLPSMLKALSSSASIENKLCPILLSTEVDEAFLKLIWNYNRLKRAKAIHKAWTYYPLKEGYKDMLKANIAKVCPIAQQCLLNTNRVKRPVLREGRKDGDAESPPYFSEEAISLCVDANPKASGPIHKELLIVVNSQTQTN